MVRHDAELEPVQEYFLLPVVRVLAEEHVLAQLERLEDHRARADRADLDAVVVDEFLREDRLLVARQRAEEVRRRLRHVDLERGVIDGFEAGDVRVVGLVHALVCVAVQGEARVFSRERAAIQRRDVLPRHARLDREREGQTVGGALPRGGELGLQLRLEHVGAGAALEADQAVVGHVRDRDRPACRRVDGVDRLEVPGRRDLHDAAGDRGLVRLREVVRVRQVRVLDEFADRLGVGDAGRRGRSCLRRRRRRCSRRGRGRRGVVVIVVATTADQGRGSEAGAAEHPSAQEGSPPYRLRPPAMLALFLVYGHANLLSRFARQPLWCGEISTTLVVTDAARHRPEANAPRGARGPRGGHARGAAIRPPPRFVTPSKAASCGPPRRGRSSLRRSGRPRCSTSCCRPVRCP